MTMKAWKSGKWDNSKKAEEMKKKADEYIQYRKEFREKKFAETKNDKWKAEDYSKTFKVVDPTVAITEDKQDTPADGWTCACSHVNPKSAPTCGLCRNTPEEAQRKADKAKKEPAEQGNLPTAQSGMFDSIKSMDSKTLIGIVLLALAVIAFAVFQFTQDGGGALNDVVGSTEMPA